MKKFFLKLITIYQFLSKDISLFGSHCVFYPSCSEYGYEAIEKYGVMHGTKILIGRIFRCRPGTPFTIDFLK